MSNPKLHEYKGKQYTVKELAALCYPVRKVQTMRKNIARMGVEAAMKYDPIKGAQLGRKVGQTAMHGYIDS